MGKILYFRSFYYVAIFIAFFQPVTLYEKTAGSHEKLIFWSVGQGDFASLFTEDECFFFDVGGSEKISAKALLLLKSQCRSKASHVYISHFDKDHIRNVLQLVNHLLIKDIYFSHLDPKTKMGKNLISELQKRAVRVRLINSNYQIQFGRGENSYTLKCLWPRLGHQKIRAENDFSLILYLTARSKRFFKTVLFTGDFPGRLEKNLLNGLARPVDILKVSHHGSKSSTGDPFLRAFSPKMCVISVGINNHYRHPNSETLARLAKNRCTILRSDTLGSLSIDLLTEN